MIEFVKMHCNGNSFIITNNEKITKCSFEKLNQNKDLKFDQLLIHKQGDTYFKDLKILAFDPIKNNIERITDKFLLG